MGHGDVPVGSKGAASAASPAVASSLSIGSSATAAADPSAPVDTAVASSTTALGECASNSVSTCTTF